MQITQTKQGEPPTGLSVTRLPDERLQRTWDSILTAEEIKRRLIDYADMMSELSRRRIDRERLGLRRALLFEGPPGCGKTSLARGLAHAWTASRSPAGGVLVQVNAHGIPSGERGGTQKNVVSVFRRLAEVASAGFPTFVVIDEVESVATDRAAINPDTNPMDTLYGVNAFIESLDAAVAVHPNVLCVFTTNMPRRIDRAVRERVDFSIVIDLPDARSRLLILEDALRALGELSGVPLLSQTHGKNGSNGIGRRLAGKSCSQDWKRVLSLTDGCSARDMRHLVVSALTLAGRGGQLAMEHLLHAAEERATQEQHHQETGGIYTYAYQRQAR